MAKHAASGGETVQSREVRWNRMAHRPKGAYTIEPCRETVPLEISEKRGTGEQGVGLQWHPYRLDQVRACLNRDGAFPGPRYAKLEELVRNSKPVVRR